MALQGQAGKKYGLIIQKRGEKAAPVASSSVFTKAKVARSGPAFEHSSDSELEKSDGDEKGNELREMGSSKKLAASDYLRMKVRAETQKDIDKALAEDPTCFQYDEVYDDISHTSTIQRAQAVNKTVEKKPKYIEGLLASAKQRQREYERRVERQIQKERETEGDQFEDKEEFVTSAYREKMKQLKEDEERERAQEAADAKMDVTKQGDLSMFYRNLLDQQTSRSDAKTQSEQKIEENKTKKEEPTPVTKHESQHNYAGDDDKGRRSRHSRSRSRSSSRHRRHHRRRSRSDSRSRRGRHSPNQDTKKRSRSPAPIREKTKRSRSKSPNRQEKVQEPALKKESAPHSIFDKRNAGEGAVLTAKERYLQRKMQRSLPLGDD